MKPERWISISFFVTRAMGVGSRKWMRKWNRKWKKKLRKLLREGRRRRRGRRGGISSLREFNKCQLTFDRSSQRIPKNPSAGSVECQTKSANNGINEAAEEVEEVEEVKEVKEVEQVEEKSIHFPE